MQPEASLRASSQQTGDVPFIRSWLGDHRILYFRFLNTGRAAVDCAVDDVRHLLNRWPRCKPFCLLIDLRDEQAVITPYGLRRVREVAHHRHDVPLRIALLTEDKQVVEVARLAGRGMCLGGHCRHFICAQEDQAISWLLAEDTIEVSSV